MKKLFSLLMLVTLVVTMVGVSSAQGPAIQPASHSVAVGPVAAAPHPEAVLWDQPLSAVNQNAIADQDFSDFPAYSSYVADDFVNAVPWTINLIYVPADGWNGFTTLLNATALNWGIWPDAGGVPAGDPSIGGQVWGLTLPPTDPQVVISNSTPGGYAAVTTLTLTTPISLPAGHWWLMFWPTMAFSPFGQFGRQASDTLNGYGTQWINPGGGFAMGTTWQTWANLDPTLPQDAAFRLEGTEDVGVGVHINKMKMNWAPAARPGLWKVVTALRVHNDAHQPQGGVTVYGDYTYPDGSVHPMSFVTTPLGQAKFPIKSSLTGLYTFTVTGMTGPGFFYDPAANEMGPSMSVTVGP